MFTASWVSGRVPVPVRATVADGCPLVDWAPAMTTTLAGTGQRPMAGFTDPRVRQRREIQAQRDSAARLVARMARDPQDEARLFSILDLAPGAGAEPSGLASALAAYTYLVAERVGVPVDAVTHEVTDTATAYLGLAARTADLPHRDLMLVWDERHGWYIAVEPCGNDRPPVICHLGGHIAPHPGTVARFVTDVVNGDRRGQLSPIPARLDRVTLAAHMAAVAAQPIGPAESRCPDALGIRHRPPQSPQGGTRPATS